MYQGKFDSKKRQASVDVSQLVAQRQQAKKDQAAAPSMEPLAHPSRKSTPAQNSPRQTAVHSAPARQNPGNSPRQSVQNPSAVRPSAPAPKAERRGPRLGGTIFYTVYFLGILLFFVATYFGLQWLQGWLVDYEAAQPTTKSREVFQQLFADPDWGALYDAAGVADSEYEGKDAFVSYMEARVGSQSLTMKSTSGGLGGKKYNVLLGDEKLAAFTLVNQAGAETETLSLNMTELPDWQLSSVEVFFQRGESYFIQNLSGHKVQVNGVELGNDNIVQLTSTVGAEKYLPVGVTGISTCLQEVTGLMAKPTVTVTDDSGAQMEVSYDEATHTFTEQTTANTIGSEETDVVRNAIQTYGLFMIMKASNADIARCFDASSDTYNTITHLGKLWTQDNRGYEFTDESFTGYVRYSDDLFSIRASVTLNVTRTDGSIKKFDIAQSMFFRKQATGKWLCYEMTNEDISTPVGKVRLTFMDGNTKIDSKMYATDTAKLSPPAVSVPDGKFFSGWYRKETDENGKVSYNLMFNPDESGYVTIPTGTTLEPMTLYALYEDLNTTEGA